MTLSFGKKIFLITGAASGIGRATVVALSKLVLADIYASGLVETRSLCTPTTRQLCGGFDVSSSQACNNFVAMVVKNTGRIDHVFNCAGINRTALKTEEITDEYYEKMMG